MIETNGTEAFPEDRWVGHSLQIGATEVRVDQRDRRCVLVNSDPDTGQPDRRVLRAIARHRQSSLGVYGTVVRPGPVTVGDPVVLQRSSSVHPAVAGSTT